MKKHTPGPWQYMVTRRHGDIVVASTSNGTVIVKTGRIDADDDCNNPECCKTVEHANAQRIVECVNAMDGIHEPIEFMDCLLDTLQKVKTMMDGTITQNLREAIYDDVTATIDDLQRNKNLPCNNN